MSAPTKKVKKVVPNPQSPTDVYDIVPTMMTDSTGTYKAELPNLQEDSKIELTPFQAVLGVDCVLDETIGSFQTYNQISERFRNAVLTKRDIAAVMNNEIFYIFKFGSVTQLEDGNDTLPAYVYGTELVPGPFAIAETVNNIVYVITSSASTDYFVWITRDMGQITDVRINGTSIRVSDTIASIQTEGTYDATTNKIATMSDIQYPVKDVYVDGSSVVDNTTKIAHITLPSGALKFLGTTTTAISDGSTTNPITINGQSVTATGGCVVLYNNKEFLWNDTITTPAWEELGDESSFALKTTTVTGTGVLGGGGALSSNQTIIHNQVNTSGAKTTKGLYQVKIDAYGHITEATIDNDVIHKSSTSGLVKNDGTIDTTTYLSTTTASNTYVPLNSANSKGIVRNVNDYIRLMYTGDSGISNIEMADTLTLVSSDATSTSNYSALALLGNKIEIVAPELKWKTTPNATAKDIATTDDITVTDVQLDGTSIVTNKIAELDSITNAEVDEICQGAGGQGVSPVLDVKVNNNSVVSQGSANIETLSTAEVNTICSGAGSNPSGLQNMLLNYIYPIGSIYMSINNVSPQNFLGGTWTQIKDTFLLGAGDTYSNGATGGEATHVLTVNEMPNHDHRVIVLPPNASSQPAKSLDGYVSSGSDYPYFSWGSNGNVYTDKTGGGQAHNNMPPYLVVYIWKRTA